MVFKDFRGSSAGKPTETRSPVKTFTSAHPWAPTRDEVTISRLARPQAEPLALGLVGTASSAFYLIRAFCETLPPESGSCPPLSQGRTGNTGCNSVHQRIADAETIETGEGTRGKNTIPERLGTPLIRGIRMATTGWHKLVVSMNAA
jgi:hypothetical protein